MMETMNRKTAAGQPHPSNEEIKVTTKRLIELAEKWGSDKYYSHSYVEHAYGALFAGREVKRLLEIGIGFFDLMAPFTPKFVLGSSLHMWADLWPDAEIFGCDIRPDTLINEGRIHTRLCDQTDQNQLIALGEEWGPFEIVIDDGAHEPESQIITAKTLLPYVSDHGIFITEDCREPERIAEATGGEIHRFNKRPDDVLIVIHK